MSVSLSLTARKARILGMRDALDVGGAKVLYYAGMPPAEPSDDAGQILLGTVALVSPCGALGDANGLATLTLNVPKTTLAVESGVIGWLRLTNGAGQGFLDLLAGLAGSGKPALINVGQVFAGGEIQLVSCTLAE